MKNNLKHALLCCGDGLHARLILKKMISSGCAPETIYNETNTTTSSRVNSFLRDHYKYWPESVRDQAEKNGLKVEQCSDLFGFENCTKILNNNHDFLVCGGCGIVPARIIRTMKKRILNAHPGLLPDFRGLDPVLWSLYKGKSLGATLHFVDSGLDTGDILIKENLKWQYPSDLFHCRLDCMELCADLIVKFLLNPGAYEPIPQDTSAAAYYGAFNIRLSNFRQIIEKYKYDETHGNVCNE